MPRTPVLSCCSARGAVATLLRYTSRDIRHGGRPADAVITVRPGSRSPKIRNQEGS
jgi:hypothetical protein